MKPEDSEPVDTDLIRRYRAASEARPVQPTEATRAAILAEARRIADAQSPPDAIKSFDTRQPAANQARWRLAALGTAGAALFAVILMVPAFRQQQANEAPRSAGSIATSPVAPQDAPADPAKPGAAPAIAAPPPPAMTPKLEALARTTRPAAKIAAGAPSRDQAVTHEALDHAAITAQQEPERRRAEAAAESTAAAAAPRVRLAPAAPPAYMPIPSQALSSNATRPDPAVVLGAVGQGNLEHLTQLLDGGAPTAVSDNYGRSPLLLAVLARREDLVRALLAHGADANAADHGGLTPLQAARDRDLAEIATALTRAGARER